MFATLLTIAHSSRYNTEKKRKQLVIDMIFKKKKTPEIELKTGETEQTDQEFIAAEAFRALSEMARLYSSIRNAEIKTKINEIMRITDKIAQDAKADPLDIPQIKRFFNYYLPTTIKLLNAYDRMSAQEIEGENISKSLTSIEEMLDTAIDAYRKRLDSLFANQALDIETDIEVMNTMMEREGLMNSTLQF